MAYELHGLLAGNVSIVTGENIKPSYGGDDEAFLRKVITPLYRVIEKVCYCNVLATLFKLKICLSDTRVLLTTFQEAEKSKKGKAPHSAWCNYDDLNEYFWSVWAWYQFSVIMLVLVSSLDLAFLFFYVFSRSSDCFSLGWPMRDDGEFFKSTRDIVQVLFILLSFS